MNDFYKDAQGLIGQAEGMDRRDFIKAAVGTGFAAAAMPVVAQNVVKTDSAGLETGVITVKVAGTDVPVYRAQPAGKTGLPVVLVISEIFGVHEHIADVARRFAKEGYLALAPELFVRHGDVKNAPNVADLIKNIIAKTPDSEVFADLDAVVEWAGKHGGDLDRLAITGFCWGGRITWMYAAHNPKIKAGVAWYGRLTGETHAVYPRHPVDVAASIKANILGLYGAKDQGIPLDTIEQMKAALAKGGSKSEFVVYPNSGHAFHADYRPSYVEADAKDGWKRTLAWFKANGMG